MGHRGARCPVAQSLGTTGKTINAHERAHGGQACLGGQAAGYSRIRVGQPVGGSGHRSRLAPLPDGLGKATTPPGAVVCDNGPETASKAMRFWSERSGVALNFIQSGKPA